MVRKAFALLFGSALVLGLSIPMLTQEGSNAGAAKETSHQAKLKKAKATKEARWEGIVIRSNRDKSTLTVRNIDSNTEKTVHYDSSTVLTSQEHGSKHVNHINADQIQDNDRVICLGTLDEKGDFHATLISKRLSNPLSR